MGSQHLCEESPILLRAQSASLFYFKIPALAKKVVQKAQWWGDRGSLHSQHSGGTPMRNNELQLNGSLLPLALLTRRAAAQSLSHTGAPPAGPLTHPSHPVHSRTTNDGVRANRHPGHRAVPVCRGYHPQPDPMYPTLLQHTTQVSCEWPFPLSSLIN